MTRFFASVLIILSIGAATAAHCQDKTITVFAAASLKNALDDVDAAFAKQTGVKVVTSYDASSALMKQIEGGAPADAFLSADLKWMDYGVEKKVINESTRLNLLGNVLVLIAAKDSKIDHVDIKPGFDLAKLADDGRIATGDVKGSPGRPLRQGCAREPWPVAVRRAEDGDDGQCPSCFGLRRTRRSAARYRLCDRC